jgi:hypothetical protein
VMLGDRLEDDAEQPERLKRFRLSVGHGFIKVLARDELSLLRIIECHLTIYPYRLYD